MPEWLQINPEAGYYQAVDIVTHAMMGVVVASPALTHHPIAAGCFMFGSVLPDLDALSRVFGKRAFLKSHQTYSHALPVIAVIGLLAGVALWPTSMWDPWAPLALVAGMVSP